MSRRRFKWIEWNLAKIAAHALSQAEVEASFGLAVSLSERADGSFEMFADTPSGRPICVIWRLDREDETVLGVFDDLEDRLVFVITAF